MKDKIFENWWSKTGQYLDTSKMGHGEGYCHFAYQGYLHGLLIGKLSANPDKWSAHPEKIEKYDNDIKQL